jgi:hypothetical protein
MIQSEPVLPGDNMRIVGRREVLARLMNRGEGRLLLYLWTTYATAQIARPYFTPFILGQLQYNYATYMLILATSIVTKTMSMPLLGRRALLRPRQLTRATMMVPLPRCGCSRHRSRICCAGGGGFAWAAFELSIILMSFDTSRRRTAPACSRCTISATRS